jgi:hypothetical protein
MSAARTRSQDSETDYREGRHARRYLDLDIDSQDGDALKRNSVYPCNHMQAMAVSEGIFAFTLKIMLI